MKLLTEDQLDLNYGENLIRERRAGGERKQSGNFRPLRLWAVSAGFILIKTYTGPLTSSNLRTVNSKQKKHSISIPKKSNSSKKKKDRKHHKKAAVESTTTHHERGKQHHPKQQDPKRRGKQHHTKSGRGSHFFTVLYFSSAFTFTF